MTARPTRVGEMILPPIAHGMKVISVGMFVEGNTPVVWRGPMLHRALQQFLADVFWGDLDVLLLDLPPGTGDIAISTAQLIPTAELVVVTTPQMAAAEVAERAGSIAVQTRQRIAGVVENMTAMPLPDGSTAGTVRVGRRRRGGAALSPDHRDRRAGAGPDPAGSGLADGRRRRGAAGAVRAPHARGRRRCGVSPTDWPPGSRPLAGVEPGHLPRRRP